MVGYTRSTWIHAGYSCESPVITLSQDIADCLYNGDRIDAIIIGFSKAFDLFPRYRLPTKIANSFVDSKAVPRVKEFLLVARRESDYESNYQRKVEYGFVYRKGTYWVHCCL